MLTFGQQIGQYAILIILAQSYIWMDVCFVSIPIGYYVGQSLPKAKFLSFWSLICGIGASFDERLQAAYTLLETVPLIDAHNDLPYNIRKFVHNQLSEFNFDVDLKNVPPWSNSNWSHTDLQRLKKGRVAAQVTTTTKINFPFVYVFHFSSSH